jgi:feruloyl-CoA synthase
MRAGADGPGSAVDARAMMRRRPPDRAGAAMTASFIDDPTWLAPVRVQREDLGGGSFVLRSPEPLEPGARCVGDWLEQWASATPDAVAFAERRPDGSWRRLTWREVRTQVGRIAQGLLERKLPADAPIAVLSDNAVDHLLLLLAGMHLGRAVCSISSAYSRLTRDFGKIHAILRSLEPSLIYASDAAVYGPALAGLDLGAPLVFSQGAGAVAGAVDLAELAANAETGAVMDAYRRITPDTHAKYLLTSGSTGTPKVVINTHRMLTANQQMMAQTWRFLAHEKPVICDWLPWSHTFGGNHNLNMVLRHGGTLVVDEGRPAPGLVEKTARNLAEVQPTLHFNVPRGFDMLLPLFEADADLARAYFARLRMIFYAAAALTQSTWDRLQALARKHGGHEVWLTTSWGATETSPAVTSAHWRLDRAGVIGLPLPGVELKFVPSGAKLEMRVRGVNVFPGYRGAPELTAQAFDEQGFYRIGDAGRLLDPARPESGVVFDGRVAEDFKLSSGTWVSVGMLRVRVVSALAPWVQDAVITGHDRDEVGALLFLSPQAAKVPAAELREQLARALRALRAEAGGSSMAPARVLLLVESPSVDAGEITDKGYINQAAVLRRREALVQSLYEGAEGTIVVA